MAEQQTQYDRINLIGHTSLETAFCIDDYPYGRFDRCKKFIWIEKALKGAKAGLYRAVYATTNPKKKGNPLNKPHASQYHHLIAYYINQAEGEKSDGYIKTDIVHSLDVESVRAWAGRNKHLMDNSPETREEVVRCLLVAQRMNITHARYMGRRAGKEFVEVEVNGVTYEFPTRELAENEKLDPKVIKQGPDLCEEFNTPWMLKKKPTEEEQVQATSKYFGTDW